MASQVKCELCGELYGGLRGKFVCVTDMDNMEHLVHHFGNRILDYVMNQVVQGTHLEEHVLNVAYIQLGGDKNTDGGSCGELSSKSGSNRGTYSGSRGGSRSESGSNGNTVAW